MTVSQPPDGLLLVDKPAGISSHDVVLIVRRALGESKIGHAGTLDPFATGLLVLLIGRATRLLPYLADEPKVYEATIAFGAETDTEDALGTVVREASRPALSAVQVAARALIGDIEQVPSAYSAKRVDGRRAYALARRGIEVKLAPVPVRIDRLETLGCDGTPDAIASLDIRVTCSGGTYVRALARDLARAAGSAAHLTTLRRLRIGVFDVNDAFTLDSIKRGGAVLVPAVHGLRTDVCVRLSADAVTAIVRGQTVPATLPGDSAALLNAENDAFVAYAIRRDDRWQPRVVMRPVATA